MKIVFSKHAKIRMTERKITKQEVTETILNPEKSGKQQDKHFAMKTRKNGQLLITYYIDKQKTVHVVTVISTSKVNKYLK